MFTNSTSWRALCCLTDSEYKANKIFHPRFLTCRPVTFTFCICKGRLGSLNDSRSYSFLPSLSLQSSAQAVSQKKTNCDTDNTIHLGHCCSSPGSICADMKHRGWGCLLPCCWQLSSPWSLSEPPQCLPCIPHQALHDMISFSLLFTSSTDSQS